MTRAAAERAANPTPDPASRPAPKPPGVTERTGARGVRAAAGRTRALFRDDPVPIVTFALFVVAGFSWLAHPWHPVEDLAITELMVRQVGHHTPLYGAYSSLPFHHPGPLLFWVLWGPYELFGQRSSALVATTIWVNGAVLAGAFALARRLGGAALPPLLAGGVLLWAHANGLPRFWEPWNPYVGALPLVALVLLAWAMLERRPWALPPAVVLGSWMVQAHIQFGPTTFALLAAGTSGLVLGAARRGGRSAVLRLWRPAAVAGLLGLLLWSPVIADLVVHGHHSNPAAIVRYYRGPQRAAIPRGDVVTVLRSALSLHPTWTGGPRPYHLVAWLPAARLAPLALPLWALAVLAAWHRRAWRELRGMAIAAIGLAAAIVSLLDVAGPNLGSWYLITVEGTGLVLHAVMLSSLLSSAVSFVALRRARTRASSAPGGPGRSTRLGRLVAGALTVVLVVATITTFHRPHAQVATADAARRMLPRVTRELPAGGPVLVEARSGLGGWVQAALVLDLVRSGRQVYARTTLRDKYPRSMSAPPPPDTVRFVVVTNPSAAVRWAPGVRVVAEATYALNPGEPPLHVVVVRAPLESIYVSVQP